MPIFNPLFELCWIVRDHRNAIQLNVRRKNTTTLAKKSGRLDTFISTFLLHFFLSVTHEKIPLLRFNKHIRGNSESSINEHSTLTPWKLETVPYCLLFTHTHTDFFSLSFALNLLNNADLFGILSQYFRYFYGKMVDQRWKKPEMEAKIGFKSNHFYLKRAEIFHRTRHSDVPAGWHRNIIYNRRKLGLLWNGYIWKNPWKMEGERKKWEKAIILMKLLKMINEKVSNRKYYL